MWSYDLFAWICGGFCGWFLWQCLPIVAPIGLVMVGATPVHCVKNAGGVGDTHWVGRDTLMHGLETRVYTVCIAHCASEQVHCTWYRTQCSMYIVCGMQCILKDGALWNVGIVQYVVWGTLMQCLGTAAYSYTPLLQSPPPRSASFKLVQQSTFQVHRGWTGCVCIVYILYLCSIVDLYFCCSIAVCLP